MKLSSKHLKTLHAIFEDPVRSDIEWTGIENLLLALGAEGRISCFLLAGR